jgi:hypothetical protein
LDGKVTVLFRVSKPALYAAIGLWLLHFGLWAYVDAVEMQYDQGDIWGLLWWIVAFWLFVLNWIGNWWRRASGGENS